MVNDYRSFAQQLGSPTGFAGAISQDTLAPSYGFRYPSSPQPFVVEPEDTGFGFGSFFQGRDLPFVRDVAEEASKIPYIGGPAEKFVSEFASPFNIALATIPQVRVGGKLLPAIIRGTDRSGVTGRARDITGAALQSISQGTFGQRLASEALLGTGAEQAAESLELPGYLRFAEPVLGGATALVGLRYGQRNKLGQKIFGVSPRTMIEPKAGMDAVDDHINTFGGTREPSEFGIRMAEIVARIPYLGDFVINPGHKDAVRPIQEEFVNLSAVQSDRLRNLLDDISQEGGLLFDADRSAGRILQDTGERTNRGLFNLDQLRFFNSAGNEIKNISTASPDTVIKRIEFKNSQLNQDAGKIKQYFDNLEKNIDEKYDVNYKRIVNEESDVATLKVSELRREGLVPLGEILERHKTFRTYFPRIASFGEDAEKIRSSFKLQRADAVENMGYRSMFDIADISQKNMGDYWYTDPEGLIQARTMGSLKSAEINQVGKALAEFGATPNIFLDPKTNPLWKAATDEFNVAKKAVNRNKQQITKLEAQLGVAKNFDRLINKVAKVINRNIEQAQKRLNKLDDVEIREIDDVISGIKDLRNQGRTFANRSRDLGKIEGSLKIVRQNLRPDQRSLAGQIGAITRKLRLADKNAIKMRKDITELERQLDLSRGEEWQVFGMIEPKLAYLHQNKKEIADLIMRNQAYRSDMADLMIDVIDLEKKLSTQKSFRRASIRQMSEQTEKLVDAVRVLQQESRLESLEKMKRLFDSALMDAPKGKAGLDARVIEKLLSESKAQTDTLENTLNLAAGKREILRKTAGDNLYEQGRVDIVGDIQKMFPSLQGRFYTPAQKQSIESLVRANYLPTPNQRRLMKSNSFMRSSLATFDLSWSFIQGWAMAFSNPVAFMRVMRVMLAGIVNPQSYKDYMRANRETLREAVENGLIIHDDFLRDEVVGARALEGAIGKATDALGGPAKGIGKVAQTLLRKSDQAFTYAGNAGRIELYKAHMNTETGIASLLGKRTAVSKKAAAEAANQLTGVSKDQVTNLENLGVFAPRYTRNMFKNIIDAANVSNHSEKAQIVRQTMFTALASTAALTYTINEMLGEETDFNPTKTIQGGKVIANPNFLTIKGLAGRDISLLGPYNTYARFFVNAFADSPEEATYRFARSKSGPIASVVGDIIEGRSLGQQPIEIQSLEGFEDTALTYALSKITPIALSKTVQTAQERGVESVITPALFLEILGVNANDMTSYDMKERAAIRRFEKPYADLTGQERDILRAEFPAMFQKQQEELKRRAKYDPKSQASLRRIEIDDERMKKEVELYDLLQTGQLEANVFRDGMSALALEASIKKSENNAESGEEADPSALSQYYATFRAAEIAPGIIDWDLQEKLEADLYRTLSSEEKKQIEQRSSAQHDPRLDWYFNNKKIIRETRYFDTLDAAFKQVGRNEASRMGIKTYNQLLIALRRAQNTGNIREEEQLQRIATRVQKLSRKKRIDMRRKNPQLDAALLQNGYVSTSVSR